MFTEVTSSVLYPVTDETDANRIVPTLLSMLLKWYFKVPKKSVISISKI